MKRLCASFACVAPILSAAAPAAPGGWEELPALTATPSDLLALFAGRPFRKDAPVLEQLHEMRASFDEAGLRTRVSHYLYRIEKASDFNGWDSVGAHWSPWFEDRPEIRARVISPLGEVTLLDPATIGEYGADDDSTDVYGDRKGLRAPLPKVTQGALVEVETTTRERALPMKAGRTGAMPLHNWLPLLSTRVILEVPESLPLAWKVRGPSPAEPQVTSRGGRKRIQITVGPREATPSLEPNPLPDQGALPIFRYGTAKDWNSLAREYGEIVETRIQGAELEAWVKEAVGTATEPDAKIALLLARLHREVRYTGVEFGEAALIPGRPGETLKRGYGDCKDKAALLVALLRVAGIPAQVALLEVGEDRDLDAEIPGFGAFNHAIVYLPGQAPRWIDATAEFCRLGELPLGDYGRLALVAAPETQGLTALPELQSSQNRSVETRTYRLVDGGPTLAKEVTETWGPKELNDRGQYAAMEEKACRENLKKYVQDVYSAKNLGALTFTDPRDLARPFKLELEILEPGTAAMDTSSASVAVNFWPLVKNLNNVLQAVPPGPEEEQPEKAAGEAKKPRLRKTGMYLPVPECSEMKVLIVPPPGFAADSVPKAVKLAVGPAAFTIDWSVNGEGAVEGHGRLDTMKRRWTPEEVNQAREALTAFGETKVPVPTFKMTGEAHLAADRLKEALAEFRKLAAAEPLKASHRIRIARALLQAGLGEEARRQAEKAVQLDPSSSPARNTQGWILQHDLLGRRFGQGWDPAGSEKAYRKAKELDPGNHLARFDLAILLEHNAMGDRYMEGSRVNEAVKEYQELRKDLKNDGLDNNLLAALARSERFKEALAFARELKPTPFRDLWRITLVACLEGSDAALSEAASTIPDAAARRTALVGAGDILPCFRRYPEASRMLLEGSAGMENLGPIRARAEALARTHKVDVAALDPKDPRTVAARLTILGLREAITRENLLPLLSPALTKTMDDDGEGSMKNFRLPGEIRNLPAEARVDVLLSSAQMACDGDERKGFRVQTALGNREVGVYVAKHEHGFAIFGFESAFELFGYEALWFLDHNQLERARSVLDRAREQLTIPGEDPLAGHPFPRLWTKGRSGSAEEATRAAAALLTSDKNSKRAVPLLLEARAKASDDRIKTWLDHGLACIYEAQKDYPHLEEVATRLSKAFPESHAGVRFRVAALSGLGRWKELEEFLDLRLETEPDEQLYQELRLTAWINLGRRPEAEKFMEKSIAQGHAGSMLFNNLAWSQVARGAVTEKTLEYARKSTEIGRGTANLHTLATVLAELGRTREACRALYESESLGNFQEVRTEDWYVLGRIAEHLGETEAARACYLRIKPDKGPVLEPDASCPVLAQRRLALLGAGGSY